MLSVITRGARLATPRHHRTIHSRWIALSLTLLLHTVAAVAITNDNPSLRALKPTDTSSPQATLKSFEETAREMVRRHRARLPPADVDRAITKVLDTLDLSGLPQLEHIDQGVESAALLLEILGRIDLPPLAQIPDEAAVVANKLDRWTIPDTEITIARTNEGPYAGRFQFTWNTVEQLPQFYELIRQLPPRPDSLAGFYEEWSYGPGPWMPAGWTSHLPAFAYTVVWNQRIWQWLMACVFLALTLAVTLLGYHLARRIDRVSSAGLNRGHFARLTVTLATIALLAFAARVLDDCVNLTGPRLFLLNGLLHVVRYTAIGWSIILALEALGAAIIRLRETHPGSIDAALVRVVVRLLGICTVFSLGIWVARSFGVPIGPLLASLGVGGVAIALAIRPTLESIIGGFVLFADKPVRVGDFCRYGDEVGTVEEIGLRSTKIRSLERSTITVPNAEFSHMKLDNISKRDMRLLQIVLNLRYETTPEQMRWILAKLRELLLGHPKVTPEPARVRFVSFGAVSKDVEIFAYLRCQEHGDFLAIKEDILLRIEDIILTAGSGFALPAHSNNASSDVSLEAQRRDSVEAQVSLWRESGQLPFPEFEEHARDRLKDVLDYPPPGSPHFKPNHAANLRHRATASVGVATEDLVDLPSFLAKLRVGNPLAEYLLNQFSAATKAQLAAYEGGADEALTAALVDELNAVLNGPSLYEDKRFEQVAIGGETRALLKTSPQGEALQRLNWLLLCDAYPSELSRRTALREPASQRSE